MMLVMAGSAAPTLAEHRSNASDPSTVKITHTGGWCLAESRNFRCWTCQNETEARNLILDCEDLRSRLRVLWGSESTERDWTPRCEIVIHRTQSAYCSTLARPGDSSVGSTRIQFDGERIVSRRIDLRCDAPDWTTAALPHELTHAVLAERFRGRPIPPWADEGIAMLSESASKRETRLADLRHALRHRSTYPIRDLIAVRQLPPLHLRDAYYGQSLVLTSWLVERTSPKAFIQFLEACPETTVDGALRKHFDFSGADALDQAWRQRIQNPETMTQVDLLERGSEVEVASATDGN